MTGFRRLNLKYLNVLSDRFDQNICKPVTAIKKNLKCFTNDCWTILLETHLTANQLVELVELD